MNISEFVLKNAIIRYGIVLFDANNAIEFINLCKKGNLTILGIDAFLLYEDGKIQPVLEHSIDFSYDVSGDIWCKASEFIKSKKTPYHYEIVLRQ